MSRPDGKRFCSCGIHKLSNPSSSLQRKWESSENEKWNKLESGSLAYVIYCTWFLHAGFAPGAFFLSAYPPI